MKLLFLGNSITRHGQKTEIGWDGDYGMAASKPENDYVHVLCDMLEKAGKHVIAKAENISYAETAPGEGSNERAEKLLSFGADIVVFRIGENIADEKAEAFARNLPPLIDAFKAVPVFIVSCFWKKDKIEKILEDTAARCGVHFVSLKAIQGEEYQAIGEYEHTGVAAHPSDKGMKAIAELIFNAIENAGLLCPSRVPAFVDDAKEKTDYAVTVDGKAIKCHSCRVSAMPFNTVWPGHQRPIEQTEVSSFISFDMERPADVRVKLPRRTTDIVIRPLRKKVDFEIFGDEVFFTLREPGQYTFEVDGRHNVLHIFANKKKSFDAFQATYRYENGVFDIGRLQLFGGESVYIAEDAVVHGEIYAADGENIKIFGRGILDGSGFKRVADGSEIGGSGLLNFARCKNVTVEGVILRDSCMWTATMINCVGVAFSDVKVIGMWRYNSDGFDFVNSQNVYVENCFLRTFDDAVVLKGLRLDEKREVEKMNPEHYVIEGCTIWCDWGGALEIGAETVADEYNDIEFRNCDIIRTDQGAMRIHSGDRAEIHNVRYENISVEYSVYDTKNVYQENDDMTYEPGDIPAHDAFIKNWMYCGVWTKDNVAGHVHDIRYDNITIYKDSTVPEPVILLNGFDAEHVIEDITVANVYLNGEKISPSAEKNEYAKDIYTD